MGIKKIILEQLILENRVDDAERLLDKLLNKSGIKEPTQLKYFSGLKLLTIFQKEHNYKYLSWMVKQMVETKRTSHVNIMTIIQLINEYHSHLNIIQQKDINSFKSIVELRQVVNEAKENKKRKEDEKKIKTEIDRVYEDDTWLVIVPKSHRASCKYGAGTQWCTTARDSYHYNEYTESGILFYFIDKTKSDNRRMYKIAMHITDAEHYLSYGDFDEDEEWEFFDAEDNEHSSTSILPMLPEKIIESINSYLGSTERIEGYQSTKPLIDTDAFEWDYWYEEVDGTPLEDSISGIVDDKGYYDNNNYDVQIEIDYDGVTLAIDYNDEDEEVGSEEVFQEYWEFPDILDSVADWEYIGSLKVNDRQKFISYLNKVLIEEIQKSLSDMLKTAEF